MNYQVTCTCRHSFLVTDDQAGHEVPCPACGQLLKVILPSTTASPSTTPSIPSTSPADATDDPTSPAAGDPPTATLEPTKRCPFCGEVILAVAKKCKHCGEFLDRAPAPPHGPPFPPAPSASPLIPQADVPPVFTLSISQWDNFWRFIILAALVIIISAVVLLIPVLKTYAPVAIPGSVIIAGFIAYFFYLSTRNSRCFIRPLRIETETGIFSKETETLELFRITDLDLKQSVFERILGIGTIKLKTNDPENPELILFQIPQARKVYKYLQDQIPIAARSRGALYMEK